MNWLGLRVQEEIDVSNTVLDLGIGMGCSTNGLKCSLHLGADIWLSYLDTLTIPTIKLNLNEPLPLDDNSFDVVLLLDVIEHLEKDKAIKLIKEAERVAKLKVIIYTPNGFVEQNKDVYNKGAEEFQIHRCGFSVDELTELKYDAKIISPDDNIYGVKIINGGDQ